MSVAITGASGAIYGLRALELPRAAEVETHLILAATARDILEHETGWTASAAEALATSSFRRSRPFVANPRPQTMW